MNPEVLARTIMFILAPVVMVNASAQLLNGLLAYYAGLDERMRRLPRPDGGPRAAAAPERP